MTTEQLDQVLEAIQALDLNEQEALFSGRDLPFGYLMERCKVLNTDYIDQLIRELGDKDLFEAVRLALTASTIRGILIGLTISDVLVLEDVDTNEE